MRLDDGVKRCPVVTDSLQANRDVVNRAGA